VEKKTTDFRSKKTVFLEVRLEQTRGREKNDRHARANFHKAFRSQAMLLTKKKAFHGEGPANPKNKPNGEKKKKDTERSYVTKRGGAVQSFPGQRRGGGKTDWGRTILERQPRLPYANGNNSFGMGERRGM